MSHYAFLMFIVHIISKSCDMSFLKSHNNDFYLFHICTLILDKYRIYSLRALCRQIYYLGEDLREL